MISFPMAHNERRVFSELGEITMRRGSFPENPKNGSIVWYPCGCQADESELQSATSGILATPRFNPDCVSMRVIHVLRKGSRSAVAPNARNQPEMAS